MQKGVGNKLPGLEPYDCMKVLNVVTPYRPQCED